MSASPLHAFIPLVDGLDVPASLHDLQGRFVHVNPGGEQAVGMTCAQLLGRTLLDLVSEEARRHVGGQFARAVKGEPTDFETSFVDAAGHRRYTRAQHLPLRAEGTVVGVLILAWDARCPPTDASAELRPQLTRRQREILDLVAAGRSTTEIARELTLAPDTVRNHLRNLLRELESHSRVEAVANAQRLGLLAARPLGPQPAN